MSDQPRIPRQIAGPIALALLIVLGLLAIHSVEPPAAADANAPLAEFSAARAMRDVREIAKAPRMLGSAENDRVRDYLVGRLRELGASPAVQTATVARHTQSGPDTWAIVNNVVATIPGTSPTGAVLMVAHYDSAPSGPGAADNAASVAAIIEAMRALKTGPAARNDLIVLFTDGEELGLLGAKGFVETQQALSNIKVVLNFEMRRRPWPVDDVPDQVATFVARGQRADFAVEFSCRGVGLGRDRPQCLSRRRNRWDEFWYKQRKCWLPHRTRQRRLAGPALVAKSGCAHAVDGSQVRGNRFERSPNRKRGLYRPRWFVESLHGGHARVSCAATAARRDLDRSPQSTIQHREVSPRDLRSTLSQSPYRSSRR